MLQKKRLRLLVLFVAWSCFLAPYAANGQEVESANSAQPDKKTVVAEGVPSKPGDTESWQAFGRLLSGNKRFVENKSQRPSDYAARRNELLTGQKPFAIVLSCSDSRVPPEIVLDQGLGDIFVVRSAGEVPDSAAIASIEYAVEHLGAKLIAVVGHESCGAVKAALTTPEGKSAGSADLDKLVSAIRSDISEADRRTEDPLLRSPVKDHATAVAKQLSERSKLLKEAIDSGRLLVVTGIYSLKSGKIEYWF